MKIKLFDKVLLKNGKTAHIVEIYEHGKAYQTDILVDDSGEYPDYETETIWPEDIDKIKKLVDDPQKVQTCLEFPVDQFTNYYINLPVI